MGRYIRSLCARVFGAKVSSETCWRCRRRENVQMLGISLGPPASCQIQGGAGVYPRRGRYAAGEKQSASSTALAPEGRIGRPTCTPRRLAPDNTETAADRGLAYSEWVNICRLPQTAIQICREGIGWLGPGRLPSWRVTGYEVTGNKLKHREMAGFG